MLGRGAGAWLGRSGGLGEFLAAGPGMVRGVLRDSVPRPYAVSWTRECRMFPHEQNHVVSLLGTARVDLTQWGLIAADEIHLWLLELPPAGMAPTAAERRMATAPRPPQARPDRMLAEGGVKLESPQVLGAMNRLEVWFQPEEAAPGGAAPAGHPPTSDPRSQPSPTLAASTQPTSAYQLEGDLTRVRLLLRGQNIGGVADISVDGGASLRELPVHDEDQSDFWVRGERIQVHDANSDRTRVHVSGKPASIEARGMALVGGQIQMDRAGNRVWIDGTGSMKLPIGRDLNGQELSRPRSLAVRWTGGMDFDGRRAVFQRQVTAESDQQRVSTEQLEVTLRQALDFAHLDAVRGAKAQPELAEIACYGGVTLDNESLGPDQSLLSRDQMRLRNLVVNQETGAVHGEGPGELTSVRRAGAAGPTIPGTALPGARTAEASANGNQLQFLRVQFARGLDGRLLTTRRELTLSDRVRSVYGPVSGWEQQLDLDDPDSLSADAVTIDCDQLTVRTLPSVTRRGRDAVELEALGNTRVDGQAFSAQAHRMTYADEKDMLVLDSGGRGFAQLIQQSQPGQPQSNLRAKRISYWLRTKQANVEGAESFDFSNLGGFTPK